jgi:hypothetical protein
LLSIAETPAVVDSPKFPPSSPPVAPVPPELTSQSVPDA